MFGLRPDSCFAAKPLRYEARVGPETTKPDICRSLLLDENLFVFVVLCVLRGRSLPLGGVEFIVVVRSLSFIRYCKMDLSRLNYVVLPESGRKGSTMGRRRERLDNRRENQIATRKKNSKRKAKERVRRAARLAKRADSAEVAQAQA